MGFLLLVLLSLLFAAVAHGEGVHSSCSSRIKADAHPDHLNTSPSTGNGIHLTLHHSHRRASLLPLPFSAVLRHDHHRINSLSDRLRSSAATVDPSSSFMSAPLTPGASLGIGNYITKVSLGTPAISYSMMVDTGSSLTWLQCLPCNISCHHQSGPIFDPAASRSYSTVPCSASECSSAVSATHNPALCTPSDGACVYEAGYGDGSTSAGLLSKDTLRTGGLLVPGFVYGCGQANRGLFGMVAGVIGLARNDLSLLSQAKDTAGAPAFSYCLPTSSFTGSLSLGPYEESKFSYTPMQSSPLDETLYFVKLAEITLGGEPIPVPPSAYDAPTIIDSGTVVTRLPPDVYSALNEAVVSALEKRYRRAPAYLILTTCFVGQASGIALPQVSLVFEGGAEMRLPTRNVMVDVNKRTTCLGFAPASMIAVIGNRQQQTFDVVYDVGESKIGFAAGGCQ